MGKYKFCDFYWQQRRNMEIWREPNISTKEWGTQNQPPKPNEKTYKHIVPFNYWEETLWKGIRENLINYITDPDNEINAHDGVHNLLSSWIQCANLYYPVKTIPALKALMVEFLRKYVSDKVDSIEGIELEFAFSENDSLHPKPLLGEPNGSRGQKQTSPDVAFLVNTRNGNKGIILTENKYTEDHFYGCSTNPDFCKKDRNPNPDFSRCMKPAKGYDYKAICHQKNAWHRKYMDLINFSDTAENGLNNCPAATDGYQLFRQQALAEGIAKSGKYELVVSSVAYDGRNEDLISCLKSTGVDDFTKGWEQLFTGKVLFKTWTHQEWVQFVRDNQKNGEF